MTSSGNDDSSVPERQKGKRRRRLWLWPLGVVGALLLAVHVAFVLWPAQSLYFIISLVLFSGRPDVPDPEFYFRVQADLVFDGEPAAIDGWLTCRGRFTKIPGNQHWRLGYHISAQYVGTRLRSGGAVYMGLPGTISLCGLAVSGNPAREAWNVSGERIPDEVLPVFFWIDDADLPTKGEIYVSEDYYTRPGARLEIKSFRIGGFTKTLPEGALLFDFRAPPPQTTGALANSDRLIGVEEPGRYFGGVVMRKIPFDEWREIPEIVTFVETLGGRKEVVVLDADAFNAAWPLRRLPTGSSSIHLVTVGVPRRNAEGAALIGRSPNDVMVILKVLDNVTPMACEAGWATQLQDRSGYWPICAFPYSQKWGVKGVSYQGQRFESPPGLGMDLVLYDPAENALIIFDDVGL